MKDGGPAFPVQTAFNPATGEPVHTGFYWEGNGMTLRDYFAAAALSGILAKCPYEDMKKVTPDELQTLTACGAYKLADAMLSERERNP